ncbi:hypothetical protein DFJ63DRAFT_338139 [Scheffersomyces coipomensis]|uniref:uncharacterized protein n=1 Tax=Scheffersomyces coipomensis TaxID=1788519 RepID=UPI00315D19BB
MIPTPDRDRNLIHEHAFYDGEEEKSSFLNLNYKFDKLLKPSATTKSSPSSNPDPHSLNKLLPQLSISQFLIILILISVIVYQLGYYLNHYLRHRRIHKLHHSHSSHSRSNSGQKLEKPEDLV